MVSMETTASTSRGQRVEGGLEQDEEDEEQDEEEDDDDEVGELLVWRAMASKESVVLWRSGSTPPLPPPIMLFMAFCISSSILCFSRFGIRPKRTAAGKELAEGLFRCAKV